MTNHLKENSQTTTLSKRSVITSACSGADSAASAIVDVDITVHSHTSISSWQKDYWTLIQTFGKSIAGPNHQPTNCDIQVEHSHCHSLDWTRQTILAQSHCPEILLGD